MIYAIIAVIAASISALLTFLILSPKLKRIQLDNNKIEKENLNLQEYNDFLLQKKNSIELEIIYINREKENLEQVLTHLIKEQEIHKNNLETLKTQAQQSANIFYEQAMKLAEQRFDTDLALEERAFDDAQGKAQNEYLQILEDCVNNFQVQIEERQAKMLELDLALNDLKAKFNAAIELQKRQQEMEEKQDFYRLQLSEFDIEEIKKLRSVIPYLRDSEPLNKVIWKVYYEKPYNDLTGRVIGEGVHTGIYKITNMANGMAYVGQAVKVGR